MQSFYFGVPAELLGRYYLVLVTPRFSFSKRVLTSLLLTSQSRTEPCHHLWDPHAGGRLSVGVLSPAPCTGAAVSWCNKGVQGISLCLPAAP